MRKVILSICAVAFIAFIAVNVNLGFNEKKGNLPKLTLKNIAALAQSESGSGNGNGVEQCIIFLYSRNFVEKWENITVKASVGVGGSFTHNGRTYKVNVAVNAGATVRIPICEKADGNCCEKSHMDKSVQYL